MELASHKTTLAGLPPWLLPFLALLTGLLSLETVVAAKDGNVVLASTSDELNAAISDADVGQIVIESGLVYAVVPEYTEDTVSPRQITRDLTISAEGPTALSFLGKPGVLLVAGGASLTLVNLTLTGSALASEITPEDNITIGNPLLVVWPSVMLEPDTTIMFDHGNLEIWVPTCGEGNDTRKTFEAVYGEENVLDEPGAGLKVVGEFPIEVPVLEHPSDEPIGNCTIVGRNVTWRCIGSQQVTNVTLASGQEVPFTAENFTRPDGQHDFLKDKPQLKPVPVSNDTPELAPALAPASAIGSTTAQDDSEGNSSGNDCSGGSVPFWFWLIVALSCFLIPIT